MLRLFVLEANAFTGALPEAGSKKNKSPSPRTCVCWLPVKQNLKFVTSRRASNHDYHPTVFTGRSKLFLN
eukprot:2819125-Amphidinium_carterae.1